MKTSTIVWVIVVIVIIIGGIWWYYGSNSMTPAPTTTTTSTTATPVVTAGIDTALGPILLAANGMALYTYNKDTTGVSNCTGTCLAAWPAYSPASGAPLVAGANVTGTLGTITRTDNGAIQLTYNGMPLYFFAQDTATNNATGQNQDGFTVVTP